MGESAFYWIGIVVVGLFVLASVLFVIGWLYANLLHGRFHLILFKRGVRRLSLASWHQTKVMAKGKERSDDDWPADDFPINERPFFLSYNIHGRQFFIMLGWLGPWRNVSIKGKHP